MHTDGVAEYFSGKINIETERLILRKVSVADASDMYEYSCRSETCEYLLWDKHPFYSYTVELTRHLQREYVQGRYMDLAIVLKESGKMIGTVGFTTVDEKNFCCEAGYVISPDYWGRGIATEALNALLNFAFCELRMKRVEAKYMVENTVSRRVMEKCGMSFEGVHRSKLFVKGRFRDIGVCSIISDDYFSVPRKNIFKNAEKISFFEKIARKCSKN